MMEAPRSSVETRRKLHASALRAVVEDGTAASVRTITQGAGITGAALYRHYAGLEDLFGAVFEELIVPMISEKENLVAMRAPVSDRVREWVRCTYACFDRDQDAFTYVFLSDRPLPARHVKLAGRQSRLLAELLEQGQRQGVVRDMDLDLACTLFIGLLLSVPKRLREGALPGPAGSYVDEVARSIWMVVASEHALPA
jgi:AcrR family transcriptional regulator